MEFLLEVSAETGKALEFSYEYLTWALILGALSAISLPLGSLLGLAVKPPNAVTGGLTAFGGGALIAALTVELVAPTALALGAGDHGGHGHGGDPAVNLIAVIIGMLVGGALFFILDAIVNEKGGFLRKTATSISYISRAKAKQAAERLEILSKVEILRNIPAEDVRKLVNYVRPRQFLDHQVIFHQGDDADRVYFIQDGEFALDVDGKHLKNIGAGEVLGEIALLTGGHRTAGAKAHGVVNTLSLAKEDFDLLRQQIPELDRACRRLAESRLSELKERRESHAKAVGEWLENAKDALATGMEIPTPEDLRKAKEEHAGAPMAIWLGILLDGIPESFVIGAGFLALLAGMSDPSHASFVDVVPYTLIAGLFLSNFPEAMSSSIGMKTQGWGKPKIIIMWSVLMVMTAIGAGVGYGLGNSADHTLVLGIEGLAAGAMLVMILSAMLPEAVHLGGSKIAGLAGLFGFLAAIMFKLMESGGAH